MNNPSKNQRICALHCVQCSILLLHTCTNNRKKRVLLCLDRASGNGCCTLSTIPLPSSQRGVFTPLVFVTTGGVGREATVLYKCLAEMSAQKQLMQFSIVMGWLRYWLSFAILRSAIMCIRGSQSFCHRPIHEEDIVLEHQRVMSLWINLIQTYCSW